MLLPRYLNLESWGSHGCLSPSYPSPGENIEEALRSCWLRITDEQRTVGPLIKDHNPKFLFTFPFVADRIQALEPEIRRYTIPVEYDFDRIKRYPKPSTMEMLVAPTESERVVVERTPDGKIASLRFTATPGDRALFHVQGTGMLLVSTRFVQLIRGLGLKGPHVEPADYRNRRSGYYIDPLADVWPPKSWWPEGHTPDPANVIEGDLEPIAVGAWLTDEERAFLEPPKKRKARPGAPLLARGWKGRLREIAEMGNGEVDLGRTWWDGDTLSITVTEEWQPAESLDGGPPKPLEGFLESFGFGKGSPVVQSLTWVLTNLERLAPQLEQAVREKYPDRKFTRPGVLLTGCADPARPEWNFVVHEDGTDFGVHVELHGDAITDVWAGT